MSITTSDTDVAIFPQHVLSSRAWRDYLVVLYWTLWSPLMFTYYGGELLRRRLEAGFPMQAQPAVIDRWEENNPGQREFVRLGIHVCLLLFLGIALVNALCAAPLDARPPDEVLAQSTLFAVLFAFVWLAQLAGGYLVARQNGNVGALLLAALPSGVFAAILMLFACWLRYTPLYLEHGAWPSRAVFLFCGFGVGFCINFALSMLQVEPLRLRTLAGLCLLAALIALVVLLLVAGVTPATLEGLWEGQHVHIWWPWVLWNMGFVFGFLRPLEWLYYLLRPQPGIGLRTRRRTWSVPGATLLPASRVQRALERHLRGEWESGVKIAAELSHLSHQQRPLAQAMAGGLEQCPAADLAERMAVVCDSGALCARDVVRPDNLRRPQRRRRAAPAAGAESMGNAEARRYAQEIVLAEALRHSPHAPELLPDRGQDPERRMLAAAYWYYGEGYLYQAADVVKHLADGGSDIAQSPGFQELSAFVATYERLLDFASVVANPAMALPPRPPVCRRRLAWAVVDRFVEAARWLWRMRSVPTALRGGCREVFRKRLRTIERLARRSTLVERKLILGVVAIWRSEAEALFRAVGLPPESLPVTLRPWDEVYRELEHHCPWLQVGAALYALWQPGRCEVIFVRSQPQVDCAQAVVLEAARHGGACGLVRLDLAHWTGAAGPPDLCQFWAEVCRGVAEKLDCTELLPDSAGMNAFTAAAADDLLVKLCGTRPGCCVVLLVENAQLLAGAANQWPQGNLWLASFRRWEQTIDNLAVTLVAQEAWGTWRRLFRRIGLRAQLVHVPLLSHYAVAEALRRQFDVYGVHFGASGVEHVHRLTGGHPELVATLGQSVADLYSSQPAAFPQGPIIDKDAIEWVLAQDERYTKQARMYSRRLAAWLGRDRDTERAWVLYRLANANLRGKNAAADAFAGLPPDTANAIYVEWLAGDIIDAAAGAAGPEYRLRSLSFAQWLGEQGRPGSAQPGMSPPENPSS